MARHPNGNGTSNTDRILIALTALALNCPSTYTIAWSKDQHKEELPVLYTGIATSAATVIGAILGDKYFGNTIMWVGLLGTLGLFGYVVFGYKPKCNGNGKTVGQPMIMGSGADGNATAAHLVIG
jgi:hypothetical protein